MNYKLKFRIIEAYHSQSRFASSCGKKDGWISRIICGRDIPTDEEIKLICTKLRIENPEEYFPKGSNGSDVGVVQTEQEMRDVISEKQASAYLSKKSVDPQRDPGE